MARDVLVGDDEGLGAGPQRGDPRAKGSNDPAPDHDVVAARAKFDFNDRRVAAKGCGHAPSFPSGETGTCRYAASTETISATIISWGPSRDCTVRSASA